MNWITPDLHLFPGYLLEYPVKIVFHFLLQCPTWLCHSVTSYKLRDCELIGEMDGLSCWNRGNGEEDKWEMSDIPGNMGGVGDSDVCCGDGGAGRGTDRRWGSSFRKAAYSCPLLVTNSMMVGLKEKCSFCTIKVILRSATFKQKDSWNNFFWMTLIGISKFVVR